MRTYEDAIRILETFDEPKAQEYAALLKSSPSSTSDDALQALTDQAQELDMGYGPNACRTCGRSGAQLSRGEMTDIIEHIAGGWDGCLYDGVGETIDIGSAIRAEGRRLVHLPQSSPNAASGGMEPQYVQQLRKEVKGWKNEAESLRRDRDGYRQCLDMITHHQKNDVWYWQGDGEDHPESMGNSMVVVIRADQLRALSSPHEESSLDKQSSNPDLLGKGSLSDSLSTMAGKEASKPQDADYFDCETCQGTGEIDETLGGEYFSNPHAKCPDCDGHGEIERKVTASQPSASSGRELPPLPYIPKEADRNEIEGLLQEYGQLCLTARCAVGKLPPLPEPDTWANVTPPGVSPDFYTADQMREYAIAALTCAAPADANAGGQIWIGTHKDYPMMKAHSADEAQNLRAMGYSVSGPHPATTSSDTSDVLKGASERQEFEKWFLEKYPQARSGHSAIAPFAKNLEADSWVAWQARAALSGAADKLDAERLIWIVHAGWEGLREAWHKYGDDGAESELAEIRGVIDAALRDQGSKS